MENTIPLATNDNSKNVCRFVPPKLSTPSIESLLQLPLEELTQYGHRSSNGTVGYTIDHGEKK